MAPPAKGKKKFVQRKLIFDVRTPKPVPPPPTPATAAAALGFSESPSPPLEENTEAQAAAFTAPTSVGLPVGPGDLSAMEEPATQPQIKKLPATDINGKLRAFNSRWYHQYPWLEYSKKIDSVFCKACRHFPEVHVDSKFTRDR